MPPPPPAPDEGGAARWLVLALLSAALLMGMSPWFSGTAVAGDLQLRWSLDAAQAARLTSLVQWGFVAGTGLIALLNLADTVPSRFLFAASALVVAVTNQGLLGADSFREGLVLRFLTGMAMAGVYPPAMKMISTWFGKRRGLAVGALVGALAIGKALPWLLKLAGGDGATGPGEAALRTARVLTSTSAAAAVAGILVLVFYRTGPLPFAARPFSWRRILEVARHRQTVLATGGYMGHMWELYAAWATVPVFLAAVVERPEPWAFAMIAAGGVGSLVAGRWADAWGRIGVANGSMWISGSCALLMGWTPGLTQWVPLTLAMIWGLTVVSDSAQFSALVTEVAPRHAVGTALTLQTMVGFSVAAFTVDLTPRLVEAWGWSVAYTVLALGPLAGIASMRALRRTMARAG
jgi:MFS family permease